MTGTLRLGAKNRVGAILGGLRGLKMGRGFHRGLRGRIPDVRPGDRWGPRKGYSRVTGAQMLE